VESECVYCFLLFDVFCVVEIVCECGLDDIVVLKVFKLFEVSYFFPSSFAVDNSCFCFSKVTFAKVVVEDE